MLLICMCMYLNDLRKKANTLPRHLTSENQRLMQTTRRQFKLTSKPDKLGKGFSCNRGSQLTLYSFILFTGYVANVTPN